jgi:hypothetical protein
MRTSIDIDDDPLGAAMATTHLPTKQATVEAALRRRGVTVRKAIDLVIATFCLERGYALLRAAGISHRWRPLWGCAPHSAPPWAIPADPRARAGARSGWPRSRRRRTSAPDTIRSIPP